MTKVERPNSAERNRKHSKKNNKSKREGASPARPESAERRRQLNSEGQLMINNAIWLEGKQGATANNEVLEIDRPNSAGRRRDGSILDNNGKRILVDQNGRPRCGSAERNRPNGNNLATPSKLEPLRKLAPLSNVRRVAADI